ncbi:unnamed protein product [Paramecium sonneborni]|uniref:Uncharacterized protein n=1 Tax=Paramecium sonneborni TaxID=65129 RepID=A0A8S1NTX6_9CILI|nr:unnamed protein product [Paramecium sonneborni]
MKSKRSKSNDQVQKQVKLVEQQTWQEGKQEEIGVQYIDNNLRSIKFFVEYTKDKQIKYIVDGNILREQQIIDTTVQPEIMRNLEQVKYLRWEGEFGKNKQKIKKWNAFWRESNLNVGGMYNENGQKQGKWIDLFPNFFDLSKVTIQGMYKQGLKQGEWVYYFENQQIANGIYNENGQKNGTWVELCDYYSRDNVLTYRGKYNNGVKFGKWDTYFQSDFADQKQLIGGGEYNKQGEKNGNWIEIHEKDFSICDIYYLGEYKNGKKQGKWDTQFSYMSVDREYQIIGGGSYDENELKTGQWIELDENFKDTSQIILEGEYVQGKKQGMWTIKFRLNEKHKFIIIGGGNYDIYGRKIGKWKDTNDNFLIQNQMIETGEYENGKRKGKWITKYRYKIKDTFVKIGEGNYDDLEVKNGRWVEPFQNFHSICQVTLVGDYLKGNKIGQWKIQLRYHEKDRFKQIGGGAYDEKGFKNGQWLELIDNFKLSNQVILQGNYLNGKKLGQWNILYKKNPKQDFQIIAGGQYNEKGLKNGNWIDLDFGFCFGEYTGVLKGEYKNGIKIKEFEEDIINKA